MTHPANPFATLIGQPLAVPLLTRSLQQASIATTYCFEGIPGIGKETTARLFAAQLLAWDGPLEHHPDFILVSVESGAQIRVQPIRDLIGQVSTYPLQAARRVVLVRTAQCLNEAAGNALLKTLEESRSTTFILLCDQPLTLATIRSRAQVIPFNPLGSGDLKTVINRVAPVLLDYPELLQSAAGSPGAALAHWKQAAQCAAVKPAFRSLPLDLEGQAALAQTVSDLPTTAQQWLLAVIGYTGWQHPGVLRALDTARRQLQQHCYAVSVWEQLLRHLATTPVTLRLDAPPYQEDTVTADEHAPAAAIAPDTAAPPTLTAPASKQGSLFSYRPH